MNEAQAEAAELPADFVEALTLIAAYMDENQLITAFKISSHLRHEHLASAVAVLAPWLGKQQVDEALELLLRIPHDAWTADHSARDLANLARRLIGTRERKHCRKL